MKNMNALMAEELRRQAMLGGNTASLQALLSDGLIYVHSTGGRDTKASYLEKLASGSLKYLALSFDDLQVHPAGQGHVVTGRMSAQVLKDGEPKAVRSLFMTVWMPETDAQGQPRMRMLAHQGTSIPV